MKHTPALIVAAGLVLAAVIATSRPAAEAQQAPAVRPAVQKWEYAKLRFISIRGAAEANSEPFQWAQPGLVINAKTWDELASKMPKPFKAGTVVSFPNGVGQDGWELIYETNKQDELIVESVEVYKRPAR